MKGDLYNTCIVLLNNEVFAEIGYNNFGFIAKAKQWITSLKKFDIECDVTYHLTLNFTKETF